MNNALNIVRQLREKQEQLTRNRILKASCSELILAKELTDKSTYQYASQRAKLKKFRKKNTTSRKNNSNKLIYMKEQDSMNKTVDNVETELQSFLIDFMKSTLNENHLHQVVKESTSMNEERRGYTSTLIYQLRDFKNMLQSNINYIKSNNNICNYNNNESIEANKENDNENGQSTTSSTQSHMKIAATLAQVLIQMRQSHEYQGQQLIEEEFRLTSELRVDRANIWAFLREDKLDEQDKKLQQDLAMTDDDAVETHLCMESVLGGIRKIDIDHKNVLLRLQNDKDAAVSLRPVGWSDQDKSTFDKVYTNLSGHGVIRSKLSETLKAQLPHKNSEEMDAYEKWWRQHKAIQNQRRDVIKNYEIIRAKAMVDAKSALATARMEADARARKEAEAAVLAAAQKELQQKLSVMYAEAAERNRQEALVAMQQEQCAALKATEAAERKKIEDDRKRALALSFKAARVAQKEADQAKQLLEEAERARLLGEEVEKNKPKVERRRELLNERAEEKKASQLALQMQQERQLEFLQRLAESVPYIDALKAATSKLDHVTAAVTAHQFTEFDEHNRGYMPLNGFTDKKLFSDARFRLGIYLREAGVVQSKVAAQVVREWNPRPNAPLPTIW